MMTRPSSPTKSNDAADLIVRGRCVLTPQGEQPAAIHIRQGIIEKVTHFNEIPEGTGLYEAGDRVVMPGLVDTHVHINEPGRTEWEGFVTATRSAAAGGITTLIEMPLNSIPATITVAGLHEKVDATREKLWVDTGFWGGVVPGNTKELPSLWEAGCFGFKCFLVESGVPEFRCVTEADLLEALPVLAELDAPLLVHAELPGPIAQAATQRSASASGRHYRTWLESRPRASENEAIELLLRLAAEHSVHIHIVHLSSSDAIELLQAAKAAGVSITVESCPHYLTFACEEIPDGATEFKCAPPIRERENREKLWEGLRAGVLDLIATDHSPCLPEMKQRGKGDFLDAWGGIASLQLSLPAAWAEARKRGFSVSNLAQWLCEAPARLAGLAHRKGSIAAGCDADLAIWNPEGIFLVDPRQLQHRHKLTPYAGRELLGIVEATFLRGQKVYERGAFCAAPAGQALLRGRT